MARKTQPIIFRIKKVKGREGIYFTWKQTHTNKKTVNHHYNRNYQCLKSLNSFLKKIADDDYVIIGLDGNEVHKHMG